MTRRIPIVATILVALAVATMIWLGTWQLQRATWKQGLLERAAAAQQLPPIAFPAERQATGRLPLFRHATGVCLRPLGRRAIAGQNSRGDSGYAIIVDCSTGVAGTRMAVQLGWTRNPNAKFDWPGGPVSGVIVPDSRSGMRLVAAGAPPGLEPSRAPDVTTISSIGPGTHRGYAATWFGLGAVALLIYAAALWKRIKQQEPAR